MYLTTIPKYLGYEGIAIRMLVATTSQRYAIHSIVQRQNPLFCGGILIAVHQRQKRIGHSLSDVIVHSDTKWTGSILLQAITRCTVCHERRGRENHTVAIIGGLSGTWAHHQKPEQGCASGIHS